MGSQALAVWQGKRGKALDNLESAHEKVKTGTPGRQWLTESINHSLITRLATELQGFARDLHDEAIDVFVTDVTVPDPDIRRVVKARMATGRQLDRGNANPGNLGTDFFAFGINLWPELKLMYPVRAPVWNTKLTNLNDARNAIAHNDQQKLDECRKTQPLTLASAKMWRSMLDQFTGGMDTVLSAHLGRLTGTKPW